MADDWNELAEKGKAARQAEDQRKAELRAKFEAAQSAEAQKQAMWRLSPLALNPLRFVLTIPGFMVWGVSFMMAFPYFRYFISGAPVHGFSKTGGRWVLDPAKDGYALFYVFVAATLPMLAAFVWKSRAWAAGRRRFAEETAWVEALRFAVLGYPAALGADEHRYKLTIYFTGRVPDQSFADVARGVDSYLRDEGRGSGYLRLVADYPRDDPPARNAQRFATTLHELVGRVLTPLLAEHPIDRIELEG
jgi:hypothetical protein